MKNGLVISTNGIKYHYLNDKFHREDGPAKEWRNGDKEWFLNGILHREDGPAIDFANGDKIYCKMGLIHREDGHAIEKADRKREYYIDDICIDSLEFRRIKNSPYYLNGLNYSQEEYLQEIKRIKSLGYILSNIKKGSI